MIPTNEFVIPLQDESDTRDHPTFTTPYFWDCDCPDRYIHPASSKSCNRCGAVRDEDHPDSILIEVVQMLKGIFPQGFSR